MAPSFANTLGDYSDEASKLDLAAFARVHPHPFLVHFPPHFRDDAIAGFQTAARASSESTPILTRSQRDLGLVVIPVRKRLGVGYDDAITIGRGSDCDISVDYSSVSKLHASFSWNEGRTQYALTDNHSTNGTTVEGKKLEPKQPCNLGDASLVLIGHTSFVFLLPQGLHALLRAIAQSDAE